MHYNINVVLLQSREIFPQKTSKNILRSFPWNLFSALKVELKNKYSTQ